MKIVILGSTGYLGRKLTDRLIEKGHDLLCLKLPQKEGHNPKATYCDVDKTNGYLNERYDCLINLCARYQRAGVKDEDVFDSNLFTPLNIFLKFLNTGIKRFITIDTSLPKNLNVYSMSKKEFSDILKWYSEKNGNIRIINVLLENFYGADEPKDRFIPSVVERLKRNEDIPLTTGDQKRDWIYVDDVINAFVKMTEMDIEENYLDFPLGSGENVEVREVIKYLKEQCNSSSKLLFGAVPKRNNEPDTLADTSLMKKYDIKIEYNWRDGFRKVVE